MSSIFAPVASLDLKPSIKRVPLWVAKGGGREIENTKTESLPAIIGEDWREETPLESPLEGSSIPPSDVSIGKISTISISIFVIHLIPLIV
jgi:hypothetical protein